ncbi:MAG TPA: TPM domain-containing protein [Thermodesulfobacteriota bacterium]|nr:TPM domain-containing protein [Thermodesulfobacteriota bacterium]
MVVKESWYVKARKRFFANKLDKFLSDEEKEQIVQAIRRAESKTSGEIRVHIEYYCRTEPLERAKEVFERLGMTNTREKNGALIYIAVGNRELAIIGDSGINDRVTPEFWQKVEKQIEEELRHGRFCQGICLEIELIGEKLKELFPRRLDDVNELSDEPSFGDESR